MKFVELGPLSRINAFLDHVNVGDSVVCGSLEAYSCKLTGLDKQVSKSLDLEVQIDAPVAELATSPVGPLSDPSSRKTLVYLILTLNQCYPDYDFSQLRARHFRKEESATDVEGVVDSHLLSVSKVWEQNPRYGGSKFLDGLWSAIDEDQASTCGEAYPVQSLQARDNTTSHPLQPIPHTRQSCRSPYKDSDSQTVPDLIPSVPLLILRPNTFVSLPSI